MSNFSESCPFSKSCQALEIFLSTWCVASVTVFFKLVWFVVFEFRMCYEFFHAPGFDFVSFVIHVLFRELFLPCLLSLFPFSTGFFTWFSFIPIGILMLVAGRCFVLRSAVFLDFENSLPCFSWCFTWIAFLFQNVCPLTVFVASPDKK